MVSTSIKKFIDETNLIYHGDVIKIHSYTQDEANQISTQSQECIYCDAIKKKRDVHKISRVDDPRPKNPYLLYIRLVHNSGRGNCTYNNLKTKK